MRSLPEGAMHLEEVHTSTYVAEAFGIWLRLGATLGPYTCVNIYNICIYIYTLHNMSMSIYAHTYVHT